MSNIKNMKNRPNPYCKSVNVRLTEKAYDLSQKYADEDNKYLSEFYREIITSYVLERENQEVK